MKVIQMASPRTGKPVANQFILTSDNGEVISFQSYKSIIARKTATNTNIAGINFTVELDREYWNYSKTTATYRNEFLGEDTKTIKSKIVSGEYKLVNLN